MPKSKFTYRINEIDYFKDKVELNQTVLVVSLPGFGCSSFLKMLKEKLHTDNVITVFTDLNMLHKYSVDDFFNYLYECTKNELTYSDNNASSKFETYRDIMEYFLNISVDSKQVVFLIDRFEKVCSLFPIDIFDAIRAVVKNSKRKVTFILGIDREITDLRTIEEMDQFYTLVNLFTYYLKPLGKEESINYINNTAETFGLNINDKYASEIYRLTGGHMKMLKTFMVLLHNENKEDINENTLIKISNDPSIKYQCERIYKHLNESHKDTLMRIISNFDITTSDEAKINKLKIMGILDNKGSIFSSLFSDYLLSVSDYNNKSLFLDEKTGEIYKENIRIDNNLTANEYKLLKYFYENAYQIINRDSLAEAVWEASTKEGVSDEAIDQLISRLREKIDNEKSNPKHIFTHRGRGFQFKP